MAKKPTATTGAITIKGSRGADRIIIGESGYLYSDADQQRGFVIEGGAGDDFLAGGIGVDRILGGAGYDDIYAQIEDLRGAAAKGTVAYDGGADQDILRFEKWTSDVGIDLGTNNISGDKDRFYFDFTLVTNGVRTQPTGPGTLGLTNSIEGVIGGFGNDLINGDWAGNYLEGGPGNDYINGKYGRDQMVGGEGNDIIFVLDEDLVSGDYTDTVPETFPQGPRGNDIFVVGGGTVGQYFVNTITDYDTRTGLDDAQYDQLWISKSFQGQLIFDQASQTVKYVWGDSQNPALGEVTLAGLTQADMPHVDIVVWDPMTGLPAV